MAKKKEERKRKKKRKNERRQSHIASPTGIANYMLSNCRDLRQCRDKNAALHFLVCKNYSYVYFFYDNCIYLLYVIY